MLPKVIFFDLDDTLVDHRNASRLALSELQKRSDVLSSVSMQRLLELWRRDFEMHWDMMLKGEITITENWSRRFRILFSAIGHEVGGNELESLVRQYGELYVSGTFPVPGAVELLDRVKKAGIHVSIITNNVAELQSRKIERCGFARYIDSMTVSGDYGVMKPDPEIFRIAVENAGTSPEDAVMLGDSLGSDVLGAIRSGIRAVWFRRDGSTPEADGLQVPVIDSLKPVEMAWNTIVSAYSDWDYGSME